MFGIIKKIFLVGDLYFFIIFSGVLVIDEGCSWINVVVAKGLVLNDAAL